MSNLKEIRTRIASVKSTRQITNAMKMVSAAKLKKAQDGVIRLRPYAHKLNDILEDISSSLESDLENIYSRDMEKAKKILIVAVTSNKGLCGGFNANIIKRVEELTDTVYAEQAEQGDVEIFSFGKHGSEYFERNAEKFNLFAYENDLLDNLSFDNALSFIEDIMQRFVNKEFDKIIIVYNKFKNAALQTLTTEQFLPIKITSEEDNNKDIVIESNYIFEPSKEEIITDLIPRSLKIQFFETFMESIASEHGARMTAMHKATDNATSLIKDLQLTYNKARQASITNEILEIVSGAEALGK
ncbi:MAG: ATP synthase F1 subunit gamma [Bacteroidales bacterium]|jgi:F-type H+-transporting ATPase subunit gamma|nr:ATP synthase F1 subunit gamma [Bacteroidales bacterium]